MFFKDCVHCSVLYVLMVSKAFVSESDTLFSKFSNVILEALNGNFSNVICNDFFYYAF